MTSQLMPCIDYETIALHALEKVQPATNVDFAFLLSEAGFSTLEFATEAMEHFIKLHPERCHSLMLDVYARVLADGLVRAARLGELRAEYVADFHM